MTDCIFCRIAAGEIPAQIVAQTPDAVAFRDLNPQAPVHVLVVPRAHYRGPHDVPATDGVWESVLGLAAAVARTEGVAGSGYRLVINSGSEGGQSVDHLHVHLLGGRKMKWPPG